MNPNTLIEIETRLHRLERQNRILILLLLAVAGIGSIAATNHATDSEIRTSHLTIVDNHGTVLAETQGVNGVVYIKKYANEVTN
jgi:hypothetical protein